MNLKNKLKTIVSNILDEHTPESVVYENGTTLKDKIDVSNPTVKFAGIRYGRPTRQSQGRRNVDFFKPEYDLPLIANAIQMDGLLRRMVNIFVEQVLKNGYEWVSKNEKLQQHISRRIKEIENLTNIALFDTITKTVAQLVSYGNAYIIKVRASNKSVYGKQYRLYGKDLYPIVGLFIAEATSMEIGLNATGEVTTYKQSIRGEEVYFDARDVIHLTYNQIPGTLTGMSSLIPILDDVRALRKLEEEIEILGFQYAIPLYLYKVGNKDIPPGPGEVEDAANNVNNMPAYGMLVVPGHHTIESPNGNSAAPVDIMQFIEHFKKRIYAGTGVSPVAMGEVNSSNRNTSEVSDAMMQTITKAYQRIIKHKLEMEFFSELMLDGKFLRSEEELEFNFPEIDLENQIKKETNIIQKWQNNLISREEARMELNYDKILDENDTFLELIEIPKIEAEGGIQLQAAQIGADASVKKSQMSSSKKNAKSTDSKVRPANQHGKSTGRPKYVKNNVVVLNKLNDILLLSLEDGSILKRNNYSKKLYSLIDDKIRDEIRYTITKYNEYYNTDISIDEYYVNDYLLDIKYILKDKINRFNYFDDEIKTGVFKKDISDFLDVQSGKIENLVKILMLKSSGFKSILINGSECEKHASIHNLDVSNIRYNTIPPYSYGCECKIAEETFNEFKLT